MGISLRVNLLFRSKRIVLIDDEPNLLFVIEAILKNEGFEVEAFTNPRTALQFLVDSERSENFPALVLSDILMPEMNGLDLLSAIHKTFPHLPVILLTAHGTIELAVKALKSGAIDFITKPFDQNELLLAVRKGVDSSPPTFQKTIDLLSCQQSEVGRKIFSLLEKVSKSPNTVALFHGEAGTGKEVLARALHDLGTTRSQRFVKINCSTISATHLEAELFGYEAGAFPGAHQMKPGKLEMAAGGTLYLDEVAQLPEALQAKLNRVLEDKEFTRMGGLETLTMSARITAATRQNLDQEVAKKRFRSDLFFRLNTIPIEVPPLRERKAEIPFLVDEFLEKFRAQLGHSPLKVEPSCLQKLIDYHWPGNIRELENLLQRMVLLCDPQTSLLTTEHLPGVPVAPTDKLGLNDSAALPLPNEKSKFLSFKERIRHQTQSLEKNYIETALRENDGNITKTATRLGLSRKGLQLKMRELGLKRPFDHPAGSTDRPL